MNSLVVFCGSNEGNDQAVINEAYTLGKTLAQQNITLIYGGAKVGIMGKLASGCLEHGGKVIGVIPEFLKQKEVAHFGLSELHITQTMHERKIKMNDLCEGIMALPGGYGTLEELFEMITWAQLGLHSKPIGILNTNGFFNYLLAFLEHMVKKGFLKIENYNLLLVDDDSDRLLQKMKQFKPTSTPKWINKNQV